MALYISKLLNNGFERKSLLTPHMGAYSIQYVICLYTYTDNELAVLLMWYCLSREHSQRDTVDMESSSSIHILYYSSLQEGWFEIY